MTGRADAGADCRGDEASLARFKAGAAPVPADHDLITEPPRLRHPAERANLTVERAVRFQPNER